MTKPIQSANSPTQTNLYNRFFEYERVVSYVEVTDEGIYQVGEVPDTYGGASITIQVVHAVFMINAKSEMVMFEFEVQPAMDKTRKTGGKITRDGRELRPKTGESSVEVKQYTIANASLDGPRKALGAVAKAKFNADQTGVPTQPIS